jgi:hypothetical protein
MLSGARSVAHDFVDRDWLERILGDRNFASDNRYQLWMIIGLEMWLRAQGDGRRPDQPVAERNER